MRPRPVLVCLALLLAVSSAPAGDRTEAWASMVVTRISAADRPVAGQPNPSQVGNRPGGSVVVRVRIAADGSLDGVSIDEGSGSADIDERAIRAVRAAAPFQPPPRRIVTLEGYTELSFALRFDAARTR